MSKIKNKNIGDVIAIQISETRYCYGTIIEDLNFVFYDHITWVEESVIEKIIKNEILFAAKVNFAAIDQGNWKILGKFKLDQRHNIVPVFFDPDITNLKISDYTIDKLEKTLNYKTFESMGLQYGGIHSASTIAERLNEYYNGKQYSGILTLIDIVKDLKNNSGV